MSQSTTLATRPSETNAKHHPQAIGTSHQLSRWGGAAGLGGALSLIGSVIVVVGMGLPDASDVETLTDFANIETGRIAEHFFYLGALVLFALHVFVLQRLLRPAHEAASLFGAVIASFGLVIMAASSVLHVSTAPLAELYTSPDTPAGDTRAIEYAWHGTQSIFDTMLATGLLLVPIGIVLFGIAMRKSPAFGSALGFIAIALGLIGTIGAVWEVIDTTTAFSAGSVLAIALFHLVVGWRTLRLDPRATTEINLT